ncbi:MAG: lysophospholipid acyltransferase family protein [Armatimonadetes bacterium]|nr:lysophospholipid acyltransferase family protein [Armatimonadota bacterium]
MKFRLVSFLAYWAARLVARTLRLRVVGEERVHALQGAGKGVILVTWHGRTLIPVARFRGRGYWAVISTSRDGEYQNCIFRRFGWQTVRGSTSARGAVQAALTMVRHLKGGTTLAFTPDGPRGPSHQVQPGAIFLAQKSGCPIIPAGISARPRKLTHAWDHYLIPLPFARAALIYGEPITIPMDADADEQRRWAERVGAAIDALESEAERMVGIAVMGEGARQDSTEWRRA